MKPALRLWVLGAGLACLAAAGGCAERGADLSSRATGASYQGARGADDAPHVREGASERERYNAARDLARHEHFDDAERLLTDLAAADTPWGEKARQHLAFNFHFEKMQSLMLDRRFDEANAVGRMLLERELTPDQTDWVHAVLDRIERFGGALSGAERASALGACRHVTVALAHRFAEDDRYPGRLTIADFEGHGPYADPNVPAGLSAIEDYRSTGHGYSLVAVSTLGHHRIRVVDGDILP